MRVRRSWGVPLKDGTAPSAASAPKPSRTVLPTAASCVPTMGRHREVFLVPAHYRPALEGPEPGSVRLVTALDVEGKEVRLRAWETEVTPEARRFLDVVYPGTPSFEYCPVLIPEEAWEAYERIIPEEWMPTRTEPEVFGVVGAMPNSLTAKIPVAGGEAIVALAPRVALDPRPRRRDPLFRLALRDIVRVQGLDEDSPETGSGEAAGEALS